MLDFEGLTYIYKHRKVVEFLANYYFNDEELLKRVKKHDMDKMYLLLFYDKISIIKFHREMSRHHDNKIPKKEIDYMEMVLDWESARYTKIDKPLNAFDTMNKFYPHLKNKILPILKKIGLASSNMDKDEKVLEYIKKELIDYIDFSFLKNNIKQK